MARADTALDPIRGAAADWYVQLSSGGATARDHRDFATWCETDPRHLAAWRRISAMMGEFDAIEDLAAWEPLDRESWAERVAGWTRALPLAKGVRWAPRAAVASLGLVAALAAVSLVTPGGETTAYATATAETRELHLLDGSRVTLGARSRIEVVHGDHVRRLRLVYGEAFFIVAKNPARPFVVEAGNTIVRAVGTRFDVNRAGQDVQIAVEEGVVEVARPASFIGRLIASQPAAVQTLGPRQQLVSVKGEITSAEPMPPAQQPGAWRQGRLSYVGTPLGAVVADAGRYYPGEISFVSDDIKALRVTMSFRTSEVGKVLPELGTILPVTVERQGDTILLRSRG